MKTKLLTQELVTRQNTYSFSHFLGMLPNPDKIFRITGKAYEALRALKDDPHVWSCVQSRKSGSLSLEYGFTGNSAFKDEFIKIFNDLDITGLIRDILEAPLFGFQPIEIIWKYSGKYLVPLSTEAKPQEWFYYNPDGDLYLKGNAKKKDRILPEEKLLVPRYEASYLNPYGHSLLSKCYWPVTFKTGGMRFWVNFTERYGMPLLIGQYTRGASQEESAKLAEVLASMTEDTVIVSPADINITMHEAARSSSVDLYKEMIKHCNSEISKAILSQTLTTELDMGSYAASQTHFRIRREVIMADIRLVEQTINKLIGYIGRLNFPTREMPVFKMLVNDAENIGVIERDSKLSATGLNFTKDYWKRTYGFKDSDIT